MCTTKAPKERKANCGLSCTRFVQADTHTHKQFTINYGQMMRTENKINIYVYRHILSVGYDTIGNGWLKSISVIILLGYLVLNYK